MVFQVDEQNTIWDDGNLEHYVPDYIKKKKKKSREREKQETK